MCGNCTEIVFQDCWRNRASVGGSSCSISSLKFALSHREQATIFSLPCLDKTSGCGQNASYACKLSAPHSQDSRLPPPETPDTHLTCRMKESPLNVPFPPLHHCIQATLGICDFLAIRRCPSLGLNDLLAVSLPQEFNSLKCQHLGITILPCQ